MSVLSISSNSPPLSAGLANCQREDVRETQPTLLWPPLEEEKQTHVLEKILATDDAPGEARWGVRVKIRALAWPPR